ATGGLGGELVPVAGPFAVFGGHGDIGVVLGEQVERVPGHAVAQLTSPPVDADGAVVGIGGVRAAGGEGGKGSCGGQEGQGAASRDHHRSFAGTGTGGADRGSRGRRDLQQG